MKFKDKHIVVVDDTESIRTFLRVALEAHGANVRTAATAAGGLGLCEQQKPDLVILDLGLPDHEGLDILPRLKRLDKHHNLPVIILTVRNDWKHKEDAVGLGADAYIAKPFDLDLLIDTIETQLVRQPAKLTASIR
jgi:two-component system, OmpR family, KDP operon response regulator KdpE